MNGITYIRVGEYLLPNITVAETTDAPPLGWYGRMHKAYLREHRPTMYNKLLLTERLYPLCREIDEAAENKIATIADRESAHEIILSELVFI